MRLSLAIKSPRRQRVQHRTAKHRAAHRSTGAGAGAAADTGAGASAGQASVAKPSPAQHRRSILLPLLEIGRADAGQPVQELRGNGPHGLLRAQGALRLGLALQQGVAQRALNPDGLHELLAQRGVDGEVAASPGAGCGVALGPQGRRLVAEPGDRRALLLQAPQGSLAGRAERRRLLPQALHGLRAPPDLGGEVGVLGLPERLRGLGGLRLHPERGGSLLRALERRGEAAETLPAGGAPSRAPCGERLQ